VRIYNSNDKHGYSGSSPSILTLSRSYASPTLTPSPSPFTAAQQSRFYTPNENLQIIKLTACLKTFLKALLRFRRKIKLTIGYIRISNILPAPYSLTKFYYVFHDWQEINIPQYSTPRNDRTSFLPLPESLSPSGIF
jgi:hypothetical protein